ncbi:hypothetical protein [Thermoflavimicrobium daqui]|jgi:hypothetical protein|uniref:Uncharacterized protein n=1 Tax=Thermoflavimicrobium daqui TaxID=2137476 RepID=A0A364K9A1_9BACL|nr:hypothetical protein [Thermoflavimicrobium daqui]RAL26871.1 hypothetical protein DL897_02150 [Thermoflavimicrobium daqui]
MVYFVVTELKRQVRSHSFWIVLGAIIALSYIFVPSDGAPYTTLDIAGVRGIYNSAWMSGMLGILGSVFTCMFGFYYLRDPISRDIQLRMGQMIGSSSISKAKYIIGKTLSNFLVYAMMGAVLTLGFISMQLIRAEDFRLYLHDYLLTYLIILLPVFLILASLTVLFDVIPWLTGAWGNIIYFIGIMVLFIQSMEQESFYDVFGTEFILQNIKAGITPIDSKAAQSDMIHFGFNFFETPITLKKFVWQGIDWSFNYLLQRSWLLLFALIIMGISTVLFRRSYLTKPMKEKKTYLDLSKFYQHQHQKLEVMDISSPSFRLTPYSGQKQVSLLTMTFHELRLMLKGMNLWWHIIALGLIFFSFNCSIEPDKRLLSFVWIWPITVWSQMAVKEKLYRTEAIVATGISGRRQFMASWLAGVILALIIGSGAIIRFYNESDFIFAWIVGALFIPTLAFCLGSLSGTRKLFEGLYLFLWYLGPVNANPMFDYMGVSQPILSHTLLLLGITILLFSITAWRQLAKQ